MLNISHSNIILDSNSQLCKKLSEVRFSRNRKHVPCVADLRVHTSPLSQFTRGCPREYSVNKPFRRGSIRCVCLNLTHSILKTRHGDPLEQLNTLKGFYFLKPTDIFKWRYVFEEFNIFTRIYKKEKIETFETSVWTSVERLNTWWN